jgi:phosphoribosylformylglycinamidine synthase
LLGREDGAPPPVDLALERKTGDVVRSLITSGEVKVVHDLSDGGLLIAAAEVALASGIGVTLGIQGDGPDHPFFFGEDQARYLIAVPEGKAEAVAAALEAAELEYLVLGTAGGTALSVTGSDGPLLSIPLDKLRAAHEGWLPSFMGTAA